MKKNAEDTATDRSIEEFITDIFRVYGYDFRGYAPASLKRRILRAVEQHQFDDVTEMKDKATDDGIFFAELLSDLTVTVTEMFRDPIFYQYLFQQIIPRLASYPSIRIWHAGCSTGEEVYSMAILLNEAGILDKSTLYGTDINPLAIQKARLGVYFASGIKNSIENYYQVGGLGSFSDYYSANHDAGIMESFLKEKIVFAEHNLVTDEVFSEVHLILCRNVFIYFNKSLQNRALDLFYRSLIYKGYMGLGARESLLFTKFHSNFSLLDSSTSVYQKLGGSIA